MDADGISSSKRSRPGRRPKEPQKLKFKPKVPPQKAKKSTAEKQQPEEPKPVDTELMKRLRTGRGAAKADIKDDHSTQNTPSMISSVDRVSIPFPQSGGHKQDQPVSSPIISEAIQIPRVFPTAANPGMFYDEDDDDDSDDDDDDNVELQENLPSSAECESFIQPAKELNLLEQDKKTRMFLFQFPKSLPLPRATPPAAVQRNGKAIAREVKEGCNLNDLPAGYMGKMLVYKSGKIQMKLGDAVFDVNSGIECGMAQDVVAMNTREKHCGILGKIEKHHVVVTPDIDSLMDENRH